MTNADFVTQYCNKITEFLVVLEEIDGMNKQYVALDLGNNIVDADMGGFPDGRTAAQFVAGVASIDAVKTTLAAGHNTNLYRLFTSR